jgi:hypothetical protein
VVGTGVVADSVVDVAVVDVDVLVVAAEPAVVPGCVAGAEDEVGEDAAVVVGTSGPSTPAAGKKLTATAASTGFGL